MASDLKEVIARWRLSIWSAETSAEVQMILDAAERSITARDAALEEAAQCIEKKHTHNVLNTPHPMAVSDAAAIRALKQDRGEACSEGAPT